MDLFVSVYASAMDNVVVNSLLMNNSGKMHFFRGAARLVRLETPKLSRLSEASSRLAGRPAVSSKTGQLVSPVDLRFRRYPHPSSWIRLERREQGRRLPILVHWTST